MRKLLILEIGVAQVALYMLLWLWDEYNASLFSLIFGAIFLFIFLIYLRYLIIICNLSLIL